MKNLKLSIAKITELVNANTEEKFKITWKRDGMSFIGKTKDGCEGMKTLTVNLRKNALKQNGEAIKAALNSHGMDCDFTAGMEPESQFYIRLTIKELAEDAVIEKVVPVKKEKTVKVQKEKVEKTPGVIATILNLIKEGPQTQAGILDKLVFAFPEREVEAMKKTVSAQIGGFKKQPTRMEQEKNVQFLITVDDKGLATYKFVN